MCSTCNRQEIITGIGLCAFHHPHSNTDGGCPAKTGKKKNQDCRNREVIKLTLSDDSILTFCQNHLTSVATDAQLEEIRLMLLPVNVSDTAAATDATTDANAHAGSPATDTETTHICFTADDHEEIDAWSVQTALHLRSKDLEAFKGYLESLLMKVNSATVSREDDENCVHAILSAAKLFARIPPKTKVFTASPPKDSVSKRLTHFKANPKWKFSRTATSVSRSRSRARSEDPDDEDCVNHELSMVSKLRTKATAFLQAGCMRKALNLLSTKKATPYAGTEEEKIECLAKQHPKESDADLKFLIETTALPSFDRATFRKLVKKAANGSSPGRTGWSMELLYQIIEKDDTMAELFIGLFLRICNNRLHDSVRVRLTNNRLLGIDKTAKKVRPIAVGETLYRLAAQMVLHSQQLIVDKHFGDTQIGINKPAGCDHVIHWAREKLTDTTVQAAVDMTNAFNSPFRADIRKALNRPEFAPFWPMWNLAYSTHSNLIYTKADGTNVIIKSERGTRQGDPLAAFFFCLVIHPILLEAKTLFSCDDFIIKSFMDDISVIADWAKSGKIIEFADFIATKMKEIGLEVHPDKSEWWSNHAPPDDRISRDDSPDDGKTRFTFRDRSKGDTFRLLGAYFGNDDRVADLLVEKAEEALTEVFEKVTGVGGQVGFVLIKNALPTKINFLLRTHPPHQTEKLTKWFDRHIRGSFFSMACATPTEEIDAVMKLATRFGGLGLTSAADTKEHAYAASKEQALKLKIDLPRADYRKLLALLLIKSQRDRMNGVYHKIVEKLKVTGRYGRLLAETSSKGASACLNSVPRWTSPMSKSVFSAVLRLKTSAVHTDLQQLDRCQFCKTSLDPQAVSHHLSGCTVITGKNASNAHSCAKEMLKALFHHCNIRYDEAEPTDYELRHCPECKTDFVAGSPEQLQEHVDKCSKQVTLEALKKVRQQRPDIRFRYMDANFNQKVGVLDISMTSTLLSDPKALETRVEKKRALYEPLAIANGEVFFAIIITDTGKVSLDCAKLAHIMAAHRHCNAMTPQNALSAIATIGCRARASSLINGEYRHGVQHLCHELEYSVRDAEFLEEFMSPEAHPATQPPPHTSTTNSSTIVAGTPESTPLRLGTPTSPPRSPRPRSVITLDDSPAPRGDSGSHAPESPESLAEYSPTARRPFKLGGTAVAATTTARAVATPTTNDAELEAATPAPRAQTQRQPSTAPKQDAQRWAPNEDESKEAESKDDTILSYIIKLFKPSIHCMSEARKIVRKPVVNGTYHDATGPNPASDILHKLFAWHTWTPIKRPIGQAILLLVVIGSQPWYNLLTRACIAAMLWGGWICETTVTTTHWAYNEPTAAASQLAHMVSIMSHHQIPFLSSALWFLHRLAMGLRWWNANGKDSVDTITMRRHIYRTFCFTWSAICVQNFPTSTSSYAYFCAHPVLSLPFAGSITYASFKAAMKAAATGASDPVESAKTAYRAVCTALDLQLIPSKLESSLEKLNSAASKYNNERLSYLAYETLRGNSHLLSSAIDSATIGCLLMSGEATLLRTFPTCGQDVWNIGIALIYGFALLVRVPVEITMAALASLLFNDSPITWLIALFLIPGFVLFPASLFMPPAERLLRKFSPDAKKYYNILLLMLFIMVVLVETTKQFLSAIEVCPDAWSQWLNPFCLLAKMGDYTTPAVGTKQAIGNMTAAATSVITNPSDGSLALSRQVQESLSLAFGHYLTYFPQIEAATPNASSFNAIAP